MRVAAVVVVALMVGGVTAGDCRSSAWPCELNGVCSTKTGVCSCDPGWSGPGCTALDVRQAVRDSGYRRPGFSSWGGSVTRSPSDGKWLMFAAEMDLGCGLDQWATNSRIVMAESDTPGGKYTFARVIKPRFAHEPTIVGPTADGVWVLLHVGAGRGQWAHNVHPPCTACSDGTTDPGSCTDRSYPHGDKGFVAPTMMLWATDPRGPWTETPTPLQVPNKDGDGFSDSNVAAALTPDGGLVGLWRGAGCACSSKCPARGRPDSPIPAACLTNEHSCWSSTLHPLHAPHWRNATAWDFGPELLFECGGGLGGLSQGLAERGSEDPFVWINPRDGSVHAILHRNRCKAPGPSCTPSVSGQHAWSVDGKRWFESLADAYVAEVQYADGGNETLKTRERPHLILDAAGHPAYLVTGVQPEGSTGGYTYTHIQPLGQAT